MVIDLVQDGLSSSRDIFAISVKLLAVSDTKSKLIGLYQLKFNVRDFKGMTKQKCSFDKCIDKQAFLIITASI